MDNKYRNDGRDKYDNYSKGPQGNYMNKYSKYNPTYDAPEREPYRENPHYEPMRDRRGHNPPPPDYYHKDTPPEYDRYPSSHRPNYSRPNFDSRDHRGPPRDYARNDRPRGRGPIGHDHRDRGNGRGYDDRDYGYYPERRFDDSRGYRDRPSREPRRENSGSREGSFERRSERRFEPYPPPGRYDAYPPNRQDNIIEDTVFVSNLPVDATIDEIAEHFGRIGIIKTDKRTGMFRIKIYTHQDGTSKGEASVSYDDKVAAQSAINWFKTIPFRNGEPLKVQMAERTYSKSYMNRGSQGFAGRGRGRDRDFSRGGFGYHPSGPPKPPFIQPGDWTCNKYMCQRFNFLAVKTAIFRGVRRVIDVTHRGKMPVCSQCVILDSGGSHDMPYSANQREGGPPNDPRVSDFRY